MINKSSYISLGLYTVLILLSLLTPKSLMSYGYMTVLLFNLFFIIAWLRILKYMEYNIISDHPKHWKDALAFDMLYMVGLPLIMHIVFYKVGEPLFRDDIASVFNQYVYYIILFIAVLLKFSFMRTKHQYFYRFAIRVLFVSINVFTIQIFFSTWWGINNLGQGF